MEAYVVDPEECADTLVIGARGHLLGNLEVVLQVPWAGVDDTEDDKVLGLDVVEVRLVSDTDGASGRVVDVVGMNSRCGLAGAGQVGVGVANVTTGGTIN